ncbi:MAG TPA: MBL fold metallo-hydrolase [Caulobacteraceae bacterium]|nr:MBL fold metallo-hydrolase [Caulobacteraceae bacterium]
MTRSALIAALLASALAVGPGHAADKTLKMLPIDMEGGGGTLFVTPEGKSLLIDTGSPARASDAPGLDGAKGGVDRIISTAKALGVKKIDYLLFTHYHADHLGGFFELIKRMPIGTVIDHGPNRELPTTSEPPNSMTNRMAPDSIKNYAEYIKEIKGHKHIVAKPGDVFHFGSLTDTIVSADSKFIDKPLPGAGEPGQHCDAPPNPMDGGIENAKSTGSILSFGKVKIAVLGDLTWNMERELFCPIDKVGHVNILLVTHHGLPLSSHPASIAAFRPEIVVMGNGAKKGAVPEVVNRINASPGLQGFWKMHTSVADGNLDGDPDYIANLHVPPDDGNTIRLDIARNGKIVVTNTRNGFSKTYQVK